MNKTGKKFVSDFFVFMIGSFGTRALSFLMVPFYTGILSTSEYGTVDIINSTCSLLLPIVSLGLMDAIFRYSMSKDTDSGQVLSVGIFICIIMQIAVFFISCVVNIFLKWEYMNWMIIQLFTSIYYYMFSNYLKAKQKVKKYVVLGLIQTFIMLALNILFLAKYKLGIVGYNLAIIVSYIVPTIIIVFNEKILKNLKFQRNSLLIKEMLRYSVPLIFSTLAWWIVSSSDRYMILFFYDDSQVGIYSVASKIPLIMQAVISIMQTVWQISVTNIYETNEAEVKQTMETFSKMFRSVGFICGSLLILSCKFIMQLIAKNDFYEGWIYAPFLILSVVFPFSTGMIAVLYSTYKKNKGVMISVLLGAFINIVMNAILLPFIGVLGATISTAICRFFISIYQLKDTEKILKFDRGYKDIIVNTILLVIQALILMFIHEPVIIWQLICFAVILYLNRRSIVKIIKEVHSYL